MGDSDLEYVNYEKDLGVFVTSDLDFSKQCEKIYSTANQRLGITRRVCHFLSTVERRRVLYLAMVRSQFEHCSIIWRPTTVAMILKMENLQKRALKWILFEEYSHYTHNSYITKCKQLRIMPLSDRFDFLDLLFFFKIVRGLIPVELPSYIVPFQGNTRLRRAHLDHLSYVSTISPRRENGPLGKGFFYRTFTKWNHLPFELRQLDSLPEFKVKLAESMWKIIVSDLGDDEDFDTTL